MTRPAPKPEKGGEVQWWLAKLDQHGNPTLEDGAHDDREGAEHALYLYQQLATKGFAGAPPSAFAHEPGVRYALARVELTEIAPTDAKARRPR